MNNFNSKGSVKYWLYVRKAIFQVFLPILLGLLTFTDFVSQTSNNEQTGAYNHLYFYTSLLLFIYTQINVILSYIFSTCSDDIMLKKEIDLSSSSLDLIYSFGRNQKNNNFIIVIKKIFKLRYSNSRLFKCIDNYCWIFGIDSPVFIPISVVVRLTSFKDNICKYNEEELLNTTLSELLTYDPKKINSKNSGDASLSFSNPSLYDRGRSVIIGDSMQKEPLLPTHVISEIDENISQMQQKIFNSDIIIHSNV